MKSYTLKDIHKYIGDALIEGDLEFSFTNAKPITEAHEDSLAWLSPSRNDKENLLSNTHAKVVICDKEYKSLDFPHTLIKVDNPKLVYLRIVDSLFVTKAKPGIHPSAIIAPSANIHPDVSIGPYTFIGECTIGKGTVIKSHCYIEDGTVIGDNVFIHSSAVIGGDGYGFSRNEEGAYERFPHIGGVLIERNVEVGANACIDRGSLGNTVIMEGTKLDNLVHIGHNVSIGKNVLIAAGTSIAGSTTIGSNTQIWLGCKIANNINIGESVYLGIGSVVINNIEDNKKCFGNPARVISNNNN